MAGICRFDSRNLSSGLGLILGAIMRDTICYPDCICRNEESFKRFAIDHAERLSQILNSHAENLRNIADEIEVKCVGPKAIDLSLPAEIRSPESTSAWLQWQKYYKSKVKGRKQAFEITFAQQIKQLSKLAITPEQAIDVINQSISNSWQGLFPIRNPIVRGGITRIADLETAIAKHPANRDSVFWKGEPTDVQRSELRKLRDQLKVLKEGSQPTFSM